MARYEQKYNLPFLVHDDGPNAPLEHQFAISELTFELGLLYYQKRTIPFIPLPETPLNEGPGQAMPDAILYDRVAEETKVIIEICQNNEQKNDLKKVIMLIEDYEYGILEGFVYKYKSRAWFRYRKGNGGAAKASSVSKLMGIDMGGFV